MDTAAQSFSGIYEPHNLRKLYYGSNVVKKHLVSCLPSADSRAFIVTGSSLSQRTPLIKQVEAILTLRHHAGTFDGIQQHAQVAGLMTAIDRVRGETAVDCIISIGGGSPIDAAKTISYRLSELNGGRFLTHIAIPTTLSAAECTDLGGTTMEDGIKKAVRHPELAPSYILYDPEFALHTPTNLFMSTGVRSIDHAVELQYNPAATWMPCRALALQSIATFFDLLPKYQRDPKNQEVILKLFLAAYCSLGFLAKQMKGSIGLSHTLGYSLGSPYGIPHGITSCLTLGHVVKLKARFSEEDADAVAGILPYVGGSRSGNNIADSEMVGDRILALVKELGLQTTLTDRGVKRDQIDVICERALGGWMPGEQKDAKKDEMYIAVRNIVESLF